MMPHPQPSTLNPQPLLRLPLAVRTVLVTTATVSAALGLDTDSISAMVDSGELRWVWDVSTDQQRNRDLRYWATELITPERVVDLSEADALAQIIGRPTELRLRGGTVTRLLLISRPQIHRLMDRGHLTGAIVGHTAWVDRASLVEFLAARRV